MDHPAIIVGGKIYKFSPRINEEDPLFNKIDLKGQIGAITKIKITGIGHIFTDENGKLWELGFFGNLKLITDQYRVIDFACKSSMRVKSYYILTDTNDLIVIKAGDDETLEDAVTISDTKFSKIFYYDELVMLIDISGNLWCNSKINRHNMLPPRRPEGQLVYQVTEGFKFVDCGISYFQVCALDSKGLLYIGGVKSVLPIADSNDYMELSKTNCPIKFRAVAVSISQTAYIDFDDNLWMSGPADLCGINADTSEKIPITKVLENVNSVSCYGDMTCVLLVDGTLLCTGKSRGTFKPWRSHTFEKVFDGHVDKLFNDKENIQRYKKTKSAKKESFLRV